MSWFKREKLPQLHRSNITQAAAAWLLPKVSLAFGLKPTGQVNKLQVAWQAPLKKGEPEIEDLRSRLGKMMPGASGGV